MSQAHSGTESCIGSSTSPSIESGRFERAVTEAMTAEQVAERFYEIHSQSGSIYKIDLQTDACTCPDCQQRGDQYVCKHTIRASLVEVIAEGVSTPTVAKVASYARDPEHGCPTEGHGDPPTAPPSAGQPALPKARVSSSRSLHESDRHRATRRPRRSLVATSPSNAGAPRTPARVSGCARLPKLHQNPRLAFL